MLTLLLMVILLATIWAARFCYRMVFYNVNDEAAAVFANPPGSQYEAVSEILEENIQKLKKIPFEQIYIQASDGVTLAGKYYHFKDNGPVQILFHGYRGNGIREFACGNQMAKKIGTIRLLWMSVPTGKAEDTPFLLESKSVGTV